MGRFQNWKQEIYEHLVYSNGRHRNEVYITNKSYLLKLIMISNIYLYLI